MKSSETTNPKEALDVLEHDLELQDRAYRARNGLLNFTTYTKPDYEVNWHHRALCKVLNKWVNKETRFLMIFMPPRHGKSELGSRRLPPFIHGKYPNAEIMAASYNATLAGDMVADVQRIMDTPEYLDLFPNSAITKHGEKSERTRNAEEHELLNAKGTYRGQGVGGSFAGRGADFIIVDDPIKGREDADSPAFRDKVWKWYAGVLRNRLEKNGSILLIMTRWHEDDLAGRLLDKMKTDPDADKWDIFTLPALREDAKNPLDPRDIGEPLWPAKYDKQDLAALKSVSARDWLSLFQQQPTAQEGAIIKRKWLRYYRIPPPRFDEIIQSWDFTFKDTETSAFVCGEVWGRVGADKYLLDEVRDRMDFIASVNAIKALSAKWPKSGAKLVEDKANGPAIMSVLKSKISGLIAVEPDGTKDARLWSVQSEYEGGNVYYPDPEIAPWIHDHIEEICGFPTAKYRDRVDTVSQALKRLTDSGNSVFTKEHIPNKIKSITAEIRGAETW